uniref:Sigma NS n=1 Tax=Avian orthoreovirus TaxID=38170 RepID=Q9E7M6_9REOV|nr:sigma NS [Avian orthoreovirus]
MDNTVRVGVSRNTSGAAGQTLFRNFYLLRCNISADGRNATKAVQSHFPFLSRAVRCLSPLAAHCADRTLRRDNVKQILTRELPFSSDLINYAHHVNSSSLTTSQGVEAARLVAQVYGEQVPFDHIYPTGSATYCPGAIANAISRIMAGFVPREGDDFAPSGPIDYLAADLIAYKFVLPYTLDMVDGRPQIVLPSHTVEEMLTNTSLLNSIDASFGIEARSDQRMTRDAAEMSSRSLNELEDHDQRGRMPWKIMLAMMAAQLKVELDALADERTESQANAHVTSFGSRLFNQMSAFVTIDRELMELALLIKEQGFAMNPGQIASKWSLIRRSGPTRPLSGARLEIRNGNWMIREGDQTLLSVSPARMA